MGSASGRALRNMLKPVAKHVVDFGHRLIFAPVRAYTSIILIEKEPASSTISFSSDLDSETVIKNRDAAELSENRWVVRSQDDGSGSKLSDVAHLFSGIATLADGVFKISGGRIEQESIVVFDDDIGREISIPVKFAPRLVKMTKTDEDDIFKDDCRILFPYDEDNRLVPERVLREEAPDLLEHLGAHKATLLNRDKGKPEKHESWYAYGRRQGLSTIPSGEVCCIPCMSKNSIRPIIINTEKTGRFLFTSGFILTPKDGFTAKDISDSLRNPDFWKWMRAHGKRWASSEKDEFISYGARLLMSAPYFHSSTTPKTSSV